MVRDLLGLELEEAGRRRGNKVTLQWLRGHFNGQVQETDTQVQIEQKARGYIMQLIGGMVVPDESSGRVHLCYLELLRDLRVVGQYSWGSAGLGTLYRALCHLSESNSKDAGGFFILLQVWAWERLPYLAPGRVGDRPPRQGAALMGRWDDKFHSPDLATHVVGHYRHSLDMQKPDEVIWQPYKDGLIELLPPFCSAALTEEHRVHVQRWQNRLQFVVQEGQPDIVGAYPDEDEYVTWYKRITVPFVSQMSASLDKLTNLLRSLISTDLSERVQAVGRQGLMCIVTQEKFLRKEPPVHGVWIPPGVVEEEEVMEDQGNGGVHADEEVAVDANVEAAEGEQHDGHGHGDDLVAQPHPQQEDHPMPMLHISPGIALSPFFTTPTDLHDGIGSSSQPGSLSESQTTPEDWTDFIVEPIGSGGESSFVDAPVAKRMRLDSAQAISALEVISGVLPISSYSEKLLEMKGEALLMLGRYEEVIQLCEQTLVFAEKNVATAAYVPVASSNFYE
ncbi:hypothetical protein Vadar_021930 [Vaccinium darrowii]|uniref:Uncharacterized protein n=1 Tax=Vaccinium darrowii TaxID=229202 RepID=A0ACB7Y9C0_9ERIC|nr:hypothetical protein Vadar_021930 [Vaccinium darrowii]